MPPISSIGPVGNRTAAGTAAARWRGTGAGHAAGGSLHDRRDYYAGIQRENNPLLWDLLFRFVWYGHVTIQIRLLICCLIANLPDSSKTVSVEILQPRHMYYCILTLSGLF